MSNKILGLYLCVYATVAVACGRGFMDTTSTESPADQNAPAASSSPVASTSPSPSNSPEASVSPSPAGNDSVDTSVALPAVFGQIAVIAYSKSTGHFGSLTMNGLLADIAKNAISSCGDPDCAVETWVRKGCTSLAASQAHPDEIGTAFSFQQNLQTVRDHSLSYCSERADDCILVTNLCTGS